MTDPRRLNQSPSFTIGTLAGNDEYAIGPGFSPGRACGQGIDANARSRYAKMPAR
jgi:hypothetical protein